jgi:hypothetical protein
MYLPFLDPEDKTISDPLAGEDSQRTVNVALLAFLAVLYCKLAPFLPFSVDVIKTISAWTIPP